MFSSPSYSIAAFLFFIFVGTESLHAAPQGYVEARLKIVSGRPVQLDDENTAPVAVQNNAGFPLLILSQGEKKQIAQIIADRDGIYRAALPPGDYVLDVEDRVSKRLRVITQPFTVVPNQTVRVDMTILVGFADE